MPRKPKPPPDPKTCPGCQGNKRVVISKKRGITVMGPCPLCKGKGTV